MKNLVYVILLLVILGCKWTENITGNSEPRRETNAERAAATPVASPNPTAESSPANKASETVSSPTMKDFTGRYVKTIMGYDNVIELRENGTGALIINDRTKDEARGNFTWKVDFNDAVFTIKEPVVNKKVIDSGEMTIRAQLIDGGKKLQTDYDLMFRARGKDVFERK